MAACARNFMPDADLFVTTPHDDRKFKESVVAEFPLAHYRVVENRGYDIAPFLDVLSSVDLMRYEYVVKLHTKRNVSTWVNRMPVIFGLWRKRLLGFCSSKARIHRCIRLFESDDSIGMIAGHRYLIVNQSHDSDTVEIQRGAMRFLGVDPADSSQLLFVAGSMFIARSRVFSLLPKLPAVRDFGQAERDCHFGTLAHELERALGYVVGMAGLRITDLADKYPDFVRSERLRDRAFDFARRVYGVTLKPVVSGFVTRRIGCGGSAGCR